MKRMSDWESVTISRKLRYRYGDDGLSIVWSWTVSQFGRFDNSNPRWYWDTHLTFYFREPEDATWFRMRWS